MKISIVVISWNGLDFLKQTVPSLIKAQNESTELIYVLNGSSDGSREFLKQYEDKITILENKENLGTSNARNFGAREAKGDYILFLDDDMLVENTDYIKDLQHYYNTLDNPAFMMPLFVDKEELTDGRTYSYGTYYYLFGINTRHKPRHLIADVQKYSKPIEIAITQGAAMFIKRSVWEELGGLDESQLFNLDDDDISTRANVYGYKNYLYSKEYIVHLGFTRRLDKHRYAWNDKTYFSGKAKAMFKNFQWSTILLIGTLSFLKMIAEAIYHTIYFMHLPILTANLASIWDFIATFGDTMKRRKVIQSNRKVNDSEFIWLKAPDYATDK